MRAPERPPRRPRPVSAARAPREPSARFRAASLTVASPSTPLRTSLPSRRLSSRCGSCSARDEAAGAPSSSPEWSPSQGRSPCPVIVARAFPVPSVLVAPRGRESRRVEGDDLWGARSRHCGPGESPRRLRYVRDLVRLCLCCCAPGLGPGLTRQVARRTLLRWVRT